MQSNTIFTYLGKGDESGNKASKKRPLVIQVLNYNHDICVMSNLET
jgi:hypothetical protein